MEGRQEGRQVRVKEFDKAVVWLISDANVVVAQKVLLTRFRSECGFRVWIKLIEGLVNDDTAAAQNRKRRVVDSAGDQNGNRTDRATFLKEVEKIFAAVRVNPRPDVLNLDSCDDFPLNNNKVEPTGHRISAKCRRRFHVCV